MAKNKKSLRYKENSIIDDNTPFAVTEAFKAARTNLMFMIDSQKDKKSDKNSIVFSSYAPMEGKSTTCLNLAITFAQTGAKILVIDADMRKPSLHKYMKLQSKPGLSDVLAEIAKDNASCVQKTDVDNLFVLPAGTIPPNPTELLISEKMDKLLDEFSPLYDYIFIDTPPIGLVTDAAVVGSKTLGIINVVNCERSKTEDIETIRSTVEHVGINLIGCIINAAPVFKRSKKYSRGSKYGYSYGYGYGYGYGYTEKKENESDSKSDSNEKAKE